MAAAFDRLQDAATAQIRSEIQGADRESIEAILDAAITIVESIVVDLNRIANALEQRNGTS